MSMRGGRLFSTIAREMVTELASSPRRAAAAHARRVLAEDCADGTIDELARRLLELAHRPRPR